MEMTGSDANGDAGRFLFEPNVFLNGPIEEQTIPGFLDQIAAVRAGTQDLVLELNTIGGDPDVARRIALEIRLFAAHSGRSAYCVGKTYVYSAGVTVLAAFKTPNRYLTSDAVLLIHERSLQQSLDLAGPIAACIQIVREKLSMLETSRRLEMESFAEFVEGSKLSASELLRRAESNCYMTAAEALEHGLIGRVLS